VADLITITVHSATALLVAERLFGYVVIPLLKKQKENGASGSKDPAYWQREFREAIDEKLDQRILPLLKQGSDSQAQTSQTLSKIETLLEELIKQRRRR